MTLVVAALAVLLLSGAASLALGRKGFAAPVAVGGAAAAAALGIMPAASCLAGGASVSLSVPWSIPGGAFHIGLDPLSSIFAAVILAVSALSAMYGAGYLQGHSGAASTGAHWFFFNALTASMLVVVTAQNAVLFLVAWECMALSSFFLVTFHDQHPDVRKAGWIYLVASHLATAFLIFLFAVLGSQAGSFEFADWTSAPPAAGALFLVALIRFGTKAGIVPVHVWLPQAHPAAPSHVSAVMSGVMIKTGIYGLLRVTGFLGAPEAWWGYVLIAVGISSGILGVLFALAQHDIKRLLAYHSVENIGIIILGMGLGLVGVSKGNSVLAVLGFSGAVLHVVNHAVFKSLLFMGAGSVVRATGIRDIDSLGGLLKSLPWTAAMFFIGAAAISALPPLNGFVSEFLIFLGALSGVSLARASVSLASCAAVASLALIGGLAAACFAKAFGMTFLGEPRSPLAEEPREAGPAMLAPMAVLSLACAAIGLLPVQALALVSRAATRLALASPADAAAALKWAAYPLSGVSVVAFSLLALVALLAAVRLVILAKRPVDHGLTWDCGYAKPTARMQYTSSSFAQPLTALFRPLLKTHTKGGEPTGVFPGHTAFSTDTPDVFENSLFKPVFLAVAKVAALVRSFQHGRIHIYILYIVLALLVLLFWKLG